RRNGALHTSSRGGSAIRPPVGNRPHSAPWQHPAAWEHLAAWEHPRGSSVGWHQCNMSDFAASLGDSKRKKRISKFQIAALLGIPLAAILFQVYVPRFLTFLSYLELPLLVTLYFALMRRSPVAGVMMGAAIGLAQDSLSPHPLGMFGIVKTLVGYF